VKTSLLLELVFDDGSLNLLLNMAKNVEEIDVANTMFDGEDLSLGNVSSTCQRLCVDGYNIKVCTVPHIILL